jgi:predicted small metal-binding protein
MKSLSCRDLGGDCDFIVYGETAELVKDRMLSHAKRDHSEKLAEMTKDEVDTVIKRMDDLLEYPKAA